MKIVKNGFVPTLSKVILVAGFTLFCQAFAESQTPLAIPAVPTQTPKSQGVVKDDFVNWELAMAENGYKLNNTHKNKVRLLNVYEKVVILRCMPELHIKLSYAGNSKDVVCNEFIAKTLEIDSSNPIALCAQHGIDSSVCKKASNEQNIEIYNPDQEEQKGIASLEEVLVNKKEEPLIRAETDKLESEFNTIARKPIKQRKAEDRPRLVEIVNRQLSLNCRRSRVRLKEEKVDIKKSAPDSSYAEPPSVIEDKLLMKRLTPKAGQNSSGDTERHDPFSTLLELKKKETPKESSSARIYEVTDVCNRYIDKAFKLDPNMALATCYKFGFYSYQCIEAKRKEGKSSGIARKDSPNNGTVRAVATF